MLALTAPLAVGCDEPITCTANLVTSVQLTVVDAESGEPVDATVSFMLDGEGPRAPEDGQPGSYALAYETEGTFEVTISADGYVTVMRTYEVTADECHVDPVADTIELVAVP